MPEPPEQEIEVFNLALELPAGERAAYLDKACARDAALRQRVEELLKASDESCPCLEGSATVPTEKYGDRIGRYKLLQQIGEGGCGVVYMAEQEEPVRRRVALKVIKLGLDTKSVIARFEAERQALAMMDHPNIARVLDAGATETGRPYFVMELVRGIKITDYCDQNNLSTRERLNLFIQVCQAIQHAHQKGIIHRDIKPSNILVTRDDRAAVPKVIDFGIAKATQGKLTDQTLFTAFEQFVGTPAYMSPEQAEMRVLDIDTRSDIYSLGVLLYELLTGQTPFDAKKLLQAGLDEIRRTIREQEPARPSTRLSTMLEGELTVTANHRQVEPPKLIHLVQGDLDWIVMKALEKDRARRYETANDLAADILRHLSNEPVVACPPSNLYRFQKMARRNKGALTVAALIAVVLVAATGVSAWQAVRANRAETLAKRRLAESKASETLAKERLADSEAISKFLTEVFQSPDPARDGRTITVAETLGRAQKKLETDLANQPASRTKLQATLGNTYYALGLYPEAIRLQEKIRDYYLANFGLKNINTLEAMSVLGISYEAASRHAEALKLQEQVLSLSRKVFGPEHPDTLMAMRRLATSYQLANREPEALDLRGQVLRLYQKMFGPEDQNTLGAMQNLASSYYYSGRLPEALKLREQVLTLRLKLNGPEHPYTLKAESSLADSYDLAGRNDELVKLREQILPLSRKVLGPEHPDTLNAMGLLANAYDKVARNDDALKLREEVFPLSRKVLGPEHPDTLDAMNILADSYAEVGRNKEATAILEKVCEANPKDSLPSLMLGIWQAWMSPPADYEAYRRQLIQQAWGTDQPTAADRAVKFACLRPTTDVALLATVLGLAQRAVALGQKDPQLPWFELGLGLAEYRNGQYEAAEKALSAAERTAGDHPEIIPVDWQHEIQENARLFRAMSLYRLNKPEEARKLFSQAEAVMPRFPQKWGPPPVGGKPSDGGLLEMWLAYAEAKALVEGSSAPVATPPVPK